MIGHNSDSDFINWCKEQREWAEESIARFDKGERWFRGVADGQREETTAKWRAKFEEIIKTMNRYLAANGID